VNGNRPHTGRRAAVALAVAAAAVAAAGSARSAAPREAGIVFARGGELYAAVPGAAPRRLTSNRVHDGMPAWAPDRARIAFVRDTAGDADVFVMRADGSGVRRLTGGGRPGRGAHDLYPAWSPDGRLIAFSSNRGGREPELYVVRPDGSGLRRLTRTPRHVQNMQPRFSPDGRFVVFVSNRVAYWNQELFRVRVADGGGLTRLTHWGSGADGAPGDDVTPSYSPDGGRIAFVSDRAGGYAVWTMRADGTGLRMLVRPEGRVPAFPRFSPDGRSLVYATFPQGPGQSDVRLWRIPAAGGRPTPLGPGTEPDW
jgi:TolB protein